jgi:hypothetical protein
MSSSKDRASGVEHADERDDVTHSPCAPRSHNAAGTNAAGCGTVGTTGTTLAANTTLRNVNVAVDKIAPTAGDATACVEQRQRVLQSLRQAGVPAAIRTGFGSDMGDEALARRRAAFAVCVQFLVIALDNAIVLAFAEGHRVATGPYIARGLEIARVMNHDALEVLEGTILHDRPCTLPMEDIAMWLQLLPRLSKLPPTQWVDFFIRQLGLRQARSESDDAGSAEEGDVMTTSSEHASGADDASGVASDQSHDDSADAFEDGDGSDSAGDSGGSDSGISNGSENESSDNDDALLHDDAEFARMMASITATFADAERRKHEVPVTLMVEAQMLALASQFWNLPPPE